MKNKLRITALPFGLLIGIMCIASLTSCGRGPCDASGPVVVYKTRGDYANYITVNLSKDGKSITARPGQDYVIPQRPIPLANGYFLKRMVGNVYLSITIDEFADMSHTYTEVEMLAAVMDTDPFSEYYDICECVGADTAQINAIIREGNLKNCK